MHPMALLLQGGGADLGARLHHCWYSFIDLFYLLCISIFAILQQCCIIIQVWFTFLLLLGIISHMQSLQCYIFINKIDWGVGSKLY